MSYSPNSIVDVWYENLHQEFRNIRKIMNDYPFIAMDTEFPGCVAKPYGTFKSNAEYQYYNMKVNVDLTKVIQIGLTFFNEAGETPSPVCSWQFNFFFNQASDMSSVQSVALLENSGINFPRLAHSGIHPDDFSELLITSGLVLTKRVKWLSFHSGHDFGYMIKILTNQRLPDTDDDFFDLLRIYFPFLYDAKFIMKSCRTLRGGLQELANNLEIQRKGSQHTAGSDSLMTGEAFFKLKQLFFEGNIDDSMYCGQLYGLSPASYSNSVPPSLLSFNSASTNSLTALASANNAKNAVATAAASVKSSTPSAEGDKEKADKEKESEKEKEKDVAEGEKEEERTEESQQTAKSDSEQTAADSNEGQANA